LADDVLICAKPVPQFVGQDDFMIAAGNSFFGQKIASELECKYLH